MVVVMEHLSTLDAGFPEVDDSAPHVRLPVGALAVLGGSMPEYEGFVRGLGQCSKTVPRLKQLLHTRQLGLGASALVRDSDGLASAG
jgi:hypothetical protein